MFCSPELGCQSEFGNCSPPKNKSGNKKEEPKVSTNYRCGKEFGKCPGDSCCSKYGWCGNTENYCSPELGCQSEFGNCLPPKDILIDDNESEEEDSLEDDIYSEEDNSLENDVESENDDSSEDNIVSKTWKSLSGAIKNAFKEEKPKISVDGRCGKGYGVCEEGYCCSKYGWCGKSTMYCTVEKGCQSKYGQCFSKTD